MKQCPFCAEHLQNHAVLCRFCGASADFSQGTGAWRFNAHIKHEPIIIDIHPQPEPMPEREPRDWHLGWMVKAALLLFLSSVVFYLWPTRQGLEATFPKAIRAIENVQHTAAAVRSGLQTIIGSPRDNASPYRPTYTSGSGNSAHDMLLSLSEEYRSAVLAKAVVTAGKPCPNGVSTINKGVSSDLTARWQVRCENGRGYMVEFSADPHGSARVVDVH